MTIPAPLIALMVSTFAIGTTEFVIVGLLPEVADNLSVSIPAAGLIVTAYALGITFGAPVLTALTSGIARRRLLLGLMLGFVAGNVLAAMSPNYEFLIAARILTALAHGVFFSASATIAASLVPPERSGSAIALMFAGLTFAMIVGVPMGTLIGQTLGWRATFMAVAVLGLIAQMALFILIPKIRQVAAPGEILMQFKAFGSPQLLLVMAVTAAGFGGSFVVFTYLAPILRDITGFADHTIGIILLVYGVGSALGNFLGGWLADRGPARALAGMFVAQAVALTAFYFVMGNQIGAVAMLAIISCLAFAPVPALQLYMLHLARRLSPAAVNAASALNISAFNIGIALGAWLGGVVIGTVGLSVTPLVGAGLAVVALALLIVSAALIPAENSGEIEV